uniref:COMM domain-containing protein n=1 Tax=Strigamia maritima TaxID=126957 RepID=T1IZI0_STRMM
MKFKFCGDLDCPDWILAEITTLSKLTSVKVKLLCSQVLNDVLGGSIDYEKVQKLTSDAKLDIGGIKASIAAISYIITSAVKYSTEEHTLSNELQQLGLPKEHSTAICKVYADNYAKLQKELNNNSLRLSYLDDLQWRLDYIISSSHLSDVSEPLLHLKMKVRHPELKIHKFSMTADKCSVILHELKEAYKVMENLK